MSDEKSKLKHVDDYFRAKKYLSYYGVIMSAAEKRSWITDTELSQIAEYTKGYELICERCSQNNVSVDEVDWEPTVKKYIVCIQTFDSTLRQKLAVSYQKICEIAKTEYPKTVLRWHACEPLLKSEYNKWLRKFAGVRKATDIFLNDVNNDDPQEVHDQVNYAKLFRAFLNSASKEVNSALRGFEEQREQTRKSREEAKARLKREQEERIAQERAKIVAAQAAREAAERAERERIAAIERRREELRSIVNEIMPVEGKRLDAQQIDCIIDDNHSTLVIAGAGSGKTTTIIGKVKYLLHTKQCTPDEILLLSFTRKSAEEMKQRIKAETGIDMDVFTFHKLGMQIITGVEGRKPTVYDKSVQSFAREGLKKYLSNSYYRQELLNYCFLKPSRAKSVFDFNSKQEMYDYNGTSPTITIKKDYVKSRCECDIANYLYRNRIRYTYEKPYKFSTANEKYSGYKPDFYLEDYDIYIEFYAVDKYGNVPKWFEGRHGKSPREAYQDSIQWKRRLHKENGTTLVELFYADRQDDRLLEMLQNKLLDLGVQLSPMNDEELFHEAHKANSYTVSNTSEIIGSVISLVKANGYTYDFFEKINKNPKNDSIIKLAKPIARDYEQMLIESGQIDFNDMIYKACKYFKYGKATHNYKYVMVDEYQDISKARCSLLKEMRQQHDYSLFCVGDDWQSIYRFAGSDVGYILDFEEYWGETARYKIENTYRFPKEILSESGYFIMHNPAQIKKELRTSNEETGELGYICGDTENALAEKLAEKLYLLPENSTVFLIGRYTADKDMLKYENSPFSFHVDTVASKQMVTLAQRSDLTIEFLTAHKSKGLQADYVFILNNKHKGMGFPSRIHSDPVINFLLRKSDDYPYSEERRLFYVALTRAKKSVYLLLLNGNTSVFADELRGVSRGFDVFKFMKLW